MGELKQMIDRLIAQPAEDQAIQLRLRWIMIWNIVASSLVLFMTLLSVVLKVWLLVIFGSVILAGYAIVFIVTYLGVKLEWSAIIFCYLITFWAFLFILKFGGIPYSHGLVFVGLNTAFSTILTNRIKRSIGIFAFYGLTIVIAGLAQPYLALPADFRPSMNTTYYVLNTIWLSGSMLFFISRYFKEKGTAEEADKRRLIEIDKLKTRLYTNITHEFRTPLTLIQGLSEELTHDADIQIGNAGKMILRNSRKLLSLINRMLALSKLESGLEKLHNIQSDIVGHVKYVVESFHSNAESKEINLEFHTAVNEFIMDFDPDKLEDIIVNLLSNALKFTPEKGVIRVFMEPVNWNQDGRHQLMKIGVRDSGTGISQDKLSKIFDRFYQGENSMLHHTEGSGIGLTIAREYVQLMQGQITVKSEAGKGTEFLITIPVSRLAPIATTSKSHRMPEVVVPHEISDPESTNSEIPLLLIVEDNEDVTAFLHRMLQNHYRIISGQNGREGLDLAIDQIPDIIISDVMMPEMDGFTFVNKIKSDLRTSHIPVIILTAKVDMQSRIQGLEIGADAYLEKPFNKQELFVRLRKLLELRKKLRQRYTGIKISTGDTPGSLSRDDEFMQKIRNVINRNLADKDFKLDELYRNVAMSRSQFYRKFSALTNMGIHKYIRTVRLHKARELLLDGNMNVTTVASEVGIPNISYFSRIFTEEFGFNPSHLPTQ